MLLNVLIVDDCVAIRKILQRLLRHVGVPLGEVYEAGDGVEALHTLDQAPVGLILSDVNMPYMDGLVFLKRVKSSVAHRQIPVVMITTEDDPRELLRMAELGAAGYVRKPFTAEQIKEELTGIV